MLYSFTICRRGGMADTPVLGAGAHACGFKSRRLHQDTEIAQRLSPYLIVGGALRFLFCLVLPQGKTTGFDRTSTYSPAHTVSISQNRGSSSYGYLRIFLHLVDNSFIMRYNVQYITKGVLLCATLGWMTI